MLLGAIQSHRLSVLAVVLALVLSHAQFQTLRTLRKLSITFLCQHRTRYFYEHKHMCLEGPTFQPCQALEFVLHNDVRSQRPPSA